jgi:hypothetical protein
MINSENESWSDLLDAWADGRLTAAEQAQFGQRCEQDADFARQAEAYRLARLALREEGRKQLRTMLGQIAQQERQQRRRRYVLAASAAVATLVVAVLWWQPWVNRHEWQKMAVKQAKPLAVAPTDAVVAGAERTEDSLWVRTEPTSAVYQHHYQFADSLVIYAKDVRLAECRLVYDADANLFWLVTPTDSFRMERGLNQMRPLVK